MKRCLLLSLMLCALLGGLPLYGQLSKLARSANAGSKAEELLTQAGKVPSATASAALRTSSVSLGTSAGAIKPSSATIKPSSSSLESSLAQRIAQLERENAALSAKILQEKNYQARLFDRAALATFRAMPDSDLPLNSFTGTVFEVTRNGKKEVFGVVATHALQDPFETPGMLDRKFRAVIVRQNKTIVLPARVVQVSSSAMGDVSLVKFQPKDETLFEPITLEDVPLTFPAQGYSQGYACNLLAKQTFQLTGQTSIGILKAHLPAALLGQRAGFCGSPVFTKDFKFVGVHVGSSYNTNDGFIAPVRLLEGLVDAFHSAQATPYAIELGGKEIVRLAMDEYIARMEFLDANQQVLWQYHTQAKFSLVPAETKLQDSPDVAFIRLKIGKTHWIENENREYIVEDTFSPRTVLVPWSSK